MLVAAERAVASWLERDPAAPGTFRTQGIGRLPRANDVEAEVRLVPFYRLHRRRYAAYWDFFTPDEWQERKREYAAEAERLRQLEAATVAYLEPGETWYERDYNYRGGDDASSYRMEGRPARRARSWFAYDLPVDSAGSLALILGFHSDDRRHSPGRFAIFIDDRKLIVYDQQRSEPPRFYEDRIAIPDALVRGKEKVTLRFEAAEDSQVPAIFSIRVVRAGERT